MAQAAAGFYQGTIGTPFAFTFEPLSFLIGLGGGALAVGIPFAASKLARRNDRKIRGKEECDDKNDIPQARFGDKRPGVKVVKDQGNGNKVAGNPIGGLTIKGGSNKPPGSSIAARFGDKRPGVKVVKDMGSNVTESPGTSDAAVAGNPIKGMTVKGGFNGPRNTGDAVVAGNPISGLTIKGGSNKPPENTGRTAGSGNTDPASDDPNTDGIDASNPVPGIGIIVKKCPGSPGCPNETASVAGNPIGGLNIKGGSNKPPENASRGTGRGTGDQMLDDPGLESTNASKPVPGIGIIVKKCPDPNNPKCAKDTK